MRYFVDIRLRNGKWVDGLLALPNEDASALAALIRDRHPEWHVKLTPAQ